MSHRAGMFSLTLIGNILKFKPMDADTRWTHPFNKTQVCFHIDRSAHVSISTVFIVERVSSKCNQPGRGYHRITILGYISWFTSHPSSNDRSLPCSLPPLKHICCHSINNDQYCLSSYMVNFSIYLFILFDVLKCI